MKLSEIMLQAREDLRRGRRRHPSWPSVAERAYQELRAHPVHTIWSLLLTLIIILSWIVEQ